MHLKLFEDTLQKEKFIRIHRSYIVKVSEIKSVKGNMIELDQAEAPFGANFKNDLLAALGDIVVFTVAWIIKRLVEISQTVQKDCHRYSSSIPVISTGQKKSAR